MEAREVAELMAGWGARGGLKNLRQHFVKDQGPGQSKSPWSSVAYRKIRGENES